MDVATGTVQRGWLMRVIAGTARGVRLVSPKGGSVRPTRDRVRESLFNILAPRIADARFLDLYSGTGANGIEALSRGAKLSVFVDNDDRSIAVIRKNIALARVVDRAQVKRLTLPNGLSAFLDKRAFDIVFADPPYLLTEYLGLFQALAAHEVLAPTGLLVIEHASRIIPEADPEMFELRRRILYGESALSLYGRPASAQDERAASRAP